MPTFVSVHTFCASHKQWYKCALAGVGVDVDAINYTTKYKYTTKIRAKFSYRDQINFILLMNQDLNQEDLVQSLVQKVFVFSRQFSQKNQFLCFKPLPSQNVG